MSGGKSNQGDQAQTQAIQTSNQIASQNQALSQQYADLAKGQLQRSNTLEQPLVAHNASITSGNMPAIISSIGPQLGSITQQTKQAQANIYNTIPQGAGRDFALGQNQIGQGQQISNLIGNSYNTALQSQAALGGEALGAGLQQEGATLSANQGATSAAGLTSQTGANMSQEAAQNKSTSMGLIGSLLGAGGNIAGASILKSDIRLKENIVPLGAVAGLPMYSYNFIGSNVPQVGPMAQEVFKKYPDAVLVGDDKTPWRVNYGILAEKVFKDVLRGRG